MRQPFGYKFGRYDTDITHPISQPPCRNLWDTPQSQVSALIMQGRIPAGSDFEQFIPLFQPASWWYRFVTGLVFTTLAVIMLLPDSFQAMVSFRSTPRA